MVAKGLRPVKPENAPAIGFSDSFWGFVQRCWDSDMKLRPKVAEVVKCLGKEAADWDGLMPPHAPAEDVAPEPLSDLSDLSEYREFTILMLP